MKVRRLVLVLFAASCACASIASAAEEPNYRIIERIKVPDGGFDYATFDVATGRVYMPRGAFTTVIDAKTGRVSQLASGESNHIALPVPGTNLIVFTQGRQRRDPNRR